MKYTLLIVVAVAAYLAWSFYRWNRRPVPAQRPLVRTALTATVRRDIEEAMGPE